MLRVIRRVLAVLAAFVMVASFAGEVHGLGDSLAVFRPVILIGALGVALLVWRWRGAQVLMIAVCAVGLWHASGLMARDLPSSADVTLYQKNLLFRAPDRGPLLADIRAVNADVVTLQEVSRANVAMLEALRDLYPHQLLCTAHSVGQVAVLSKTPIQDAHCGQDPGMARGVTQIDGRLVQVISLHLYWPWPHSQRGQAQRLIGELEPLEDGVTVIGGDFNMVASGRSIAWFEQATDAQRVGRLTRTFDLFGYPLGIDHVLATGGVGTLTVRPLLGSDHFGLLAEVVFP